MYCNKCGTHLEATAKFCAKCGNTMSSGGNSTVRKKSRMLPIVAATAALGVAVIAVFLVARESEPPDAEIGVQETTATREELLAERAAYSPADRQEEYPSHRQAQETSPPDSYRHLCELAEQLIGTWFPPYHRLIDSEDYRHSKPHLEDTVVIFDKHSRVFVPYISRTSSSLVEVFGWFPIMTHSTAPIWERGQGGSSPGRIGYFEVNSDTITKTFRPSDDAHLCDLPFNKDLTVATPFYFDGEYLYMDFGFGMMPWWRPPYVNISDTRSAAQVGTDPDWFIDRWTPSARLLYSPQYYWLTFLDGHSFERSSESSSNRDDSRRVFGAYRIRPGVISFYYPRNCSNECFFMCRACERRDDSADRREVEFMETHEFRFDILGGQLLKKHPEGYVPWIRASDVGIRLSPPASEIITTRPIGFRSGGRDITLDDVGDDTFWLWNNRLLRFFTDNTFPPFHVFDPAAAEFYCVYTDPREPPAANQGIEITAVPAEDRGVETTEASAAQALPWALPLRMIIGYWECDPATCTGSEMCVISIEPFGTGIYFNDNTGNFSGYVRFTKYTVDLVVVNGDTFRVSFVNDTSYSATSWSIEILGDVKTFVRTSNMEGVPVVTALVDPATAIIGSWLCTGMNCTLGICAPLFNEDGTFTHGAGGRLSGTWELQEFNNALFLATNAGHNVILRREIEFINQDVMRLTVRGVTGTPTGPMKSYARKGAIGWSDIQAAESTRIFEERIAEMHAAAAEAAARRLEEQQAEAARIAERHAEAVQAAPDFLVGAWLARMPVDGEITRSINNWFDGRAQERALAAGAWRGLERWLKKDANVFNVAGAAIRGGLDAHGTAMEAIEGERNQVIRDAIASLPRRVEFRANGTYTLTTDRGTSEHTWHVNTQHSPAQGTNVTIIGSSHIFEKVAFSDRLTVFVYSPGFNTQFSLHLTVE